MDSGRGQENDVFFDRLKPKTVRFDVDSQKLLQNNLIQEFICKYDCIKSLHISDKTLEKALTKNILYNGNYFKYLGCKIKCF